MKRLIQTTNHGAGTMLEQQFLRPYSVAGLVASEGPKLLALIALLYVGILGAERPEAFWIR
jgi:hypothetical protein